MLSYAVLVVQRSFDHNIKIHYSCEIEALVETHVRKLNIPEIGAQQILRFF